MGEESLILNGASLVDYKQSSIYITVVMRRTLSSLF